MPVDSRINIKSFIDSRPIAWPQYLLAALCFLVVMTDGIDVAIMAYLAPSIMQEWGISRTQFGIVMSLAPVGLVIGALCAGPISDRLGRKKILVTSVFLFGLCCLLTAFTSSTLQMAVMRLLTGIGLGAAMPITTTLLSEYVPERRRGLMITTMSIGFGVGSAAVGFAAGWMIPHWGWRSVLMLGGILPLMLVPLLVWLLPESARFMLVRGQAMTQIARMLERVCRTSLPAGTTFFSDEPSTPAKAPFRLLFQHNLGRTTLALWCTYFMGLLVIYLLTGWLPTLIKDAGLPITEAAHVTAMFQTGGIVGAILTGWAMDRGYPTRVIATAYFLGALCVLGVGQSGPLAGSLPFWMLAAGFFINGAQTGLNAHAPSCYPTAVRATGVSWMLGMGRFGSIFGTAAGGLLLSLGWTFSGIVSLLAIPTALAGVAIIASAIRPARTTPQSLPQASRLPS
ncbi:MFS transporter [Kerstersia similis]|uniref:MFS transporter n=1 Tax=Kerstersia similis TaxID=206505 RepID=UPI0039EE842E